METDAVLTVVVPAFNEEARIAATLERLRNHLSSRPWPWTIVVVDDGSTDETAAVVEGLASYAPGIVLQREPHRGKGGAVRAGLLGARGTHRFICDADLSMPVTELDRFMPPALGDADIAIGTREGLGARRFDEPILRHLAGRAFNHAVRALMVPDIQDTQCGFKMFTARAVEQIFPYVRVNEWAFDVEVLYLARIRGLRVRQVPIQWYYHRDSRVRILRDGAGMFRELLRIRQRATRGEYAVQSPKPPL